VARPTGGAGALVAAAGLVAGLLAGLAALAPPPALADDPATAAPDATVRMTNQLAFEPRELRIPVGGVVQWHNDSVLVHTATADPAKAARPEKSVALPQGAEPFDSGLLDPGERWRRRFDEPGRYRYFCIPHEAAGMVGTVVVGDAEPESAEAP